MAALGALVGASCGGRDADLLIEIERRDHPGTLAVYICGAELTSPCKRAEVFSSGDGVAALEIGVFVDDDTEEMDLNFQLGSPAACAHFHVNWTMDPEVKIALEPDGASPIHVLDCTTCTTPTLDCNYVGRGE
jgi:hypothetical protein